MHSTVVKFVGIYSFFSSEFTFPFLIFIRKSQYKYILQEILTFLLLDSQVTYKEDNFEILSSTQYLMFHALPTSNIIHKLAGRTKRQRKETVSVQLIS